VVVISNCVVCTNESPRSVIDWPAGRFERDWTEMFRWVSWGGGCSQGYLGCSRPLWIPVRRAERL